jgi:hypothetical protein
MAAAPRQYAPIRTIGTRGCSAARRYFSSISIPPTSPAARL